MLLRKPKPKYISVEISVIADPKLSLAAKGLYCVITNLERVSYSDLVAMYGEEVAVLGGELKRAGLIRFEREEEDG